MQESQMRTMSSLEPRSERGRNLEHLLYRTQCLPVRPPLYRPCGVSGKVPASEPQGSRFESHHQRIFSANIRLYIHRHMAQMYSHAFNILKYHGALAPMRSKAVRQQFPP